MFHTVRMRFLSTLDPTTIKDLDNLNHRYFKWLEDDFKRKAHSGLNGLSPHDVLMSQISKLHLATDIGRINENFLLRVTRKVQGDATIQIDNILYETDARFSGRRMEIRYEPEWLKDMTKILPLYEDGKKVGGAKMVRFHDNAHAVRRFKGNRRKNDNPKSDESSVVPDTPVAKNSISFSEMMGGND